MNLPCGWYARFDDLTKRVECFKNVHRNGRAVTHAWLEGRIRAIDPKSGVRRIDHASKLPPLAAAFLQAECERRWSDL